MKYVECTALNIETGEKVVGTIGEVATHLGVKETTLHLSARNNKPCKKVWQITKDEKDIDANEDRERLDVGKIRALKRANWTVQAVADDMGLSITTVAPIYYSI